MDTEPALDATAKILSGLAEFGIAARLDGPDVLLEWEGKKWRRPASRPPETATRERLQQWLEVSRSDGFLLAERIPPSLAARARDRGIWHADAHGRAFVRAPGLRIDVRQAESPRRVMLPGSAARPPRVVGTLSSPARAQVIFTLLAWPDLVGAPISTLAHVSGSSQGSTHATLTSLEEDGYLALGRHRLLRARALLDTWSRTFPRGLARRLRLGSFTGDPRVDAWTEVDYPVHVSGDAAGGEDLRGPGLVLYVRELEPDLVRRSRWRGGGVEGNIVVRRQFWHEPPSVQHSAAPPAGPRIAPWPLVYADLMSTGDPRSAEAATQLLERSWIS